MKVHEALARALADNGGDTLFGLIGNGNLYFVNSYVRHAGGRYVSSCAEGGAVLMALGYAQVSGNVGLATVTYGPALTNTVTALVEGAKGRASIVLVCGDVPAIDRDNLQRTSHREVIMATGAGFEQARSPKTVAMDFARALRRARLEKRPIAFNVPADFMHEEVVYEPTVVRFQSSMVEPTMSADMEEAVGIIASARRPVILAGRGAISPQAREALLALGERIAAPLATTLRAKDLFRGERFNLGIMGTLSTPVAVETLMASDCILSFGSSLNKWTTSNGSFVEKKRVVQCMLEADQIGRFHIPTVGIVGDPGATARTLHSWLDKAEIESSAFRDDALAAAIADYSVLKDFKDLSTESTIDMRVAFARIEAAVAPNRIFLTDGGRFMSQALKMFSVEEPTSYVFGSNFGSIGLGLPYAIGASCARVDHPVLLVIGDGGFMLGGLVELSTAVRHRIPLIVILCNDSAYGAEYVQYRDRGIDPSISVFEWPEFAEVANAMGACGFTVRTREDLDKAVGAIASTRGPLLIDLKGHPDRMPEASY
jgi:acetolactate synthase I/II/III large subunit